MKINLGEVLTKAWQITWKFKVLWIFGILAGCAGNNRYNFNSNNNVGNGFNFNNDSQLPAPFREFANMQPQQAFRQFMGQYMTLIAFVILILCVLWLIFFYLGVMGKTGLIKGIGQADAGAESLHFDSLWELATPYFWRMVGLRLLIGLPIFLITVMVVVGAGFALFSAGQNGLTGAGLAAMMLGLGGVTISVICIVGLLAIVIGLITAQAENAIVLEDLGVLQGLSRGWQVFTANLLPVILIALILGVIGWIVSLLVALPLFAIMLPVMFGIVTTGGTNNFGLPMMVEGALFLLYLPVLLTINGILLTYTQSVWTLAYRRLTISPAQPAPEQVFTNPAQ